VALTRRYALSGCVRMFVASRTGPTVSHAITGHGEAAGNLTCVGWEVDTG
jgi:hypothetical protein